MSGKIEAHGRDESFSPAGSMSCKRECVYDVMMMMVKMCVTLIRAMANMDEERNPPRLGGRIPYQLQWPWPPPSDAEMREKSSDKVSNTSSLRRHRPMKRNNNDGLTKINVARRKLMISRGELEDLVFTFRLAPGDK